MEDNTVKCAACGHDASGKFCNNCGAQLGSQPCSSCEAPLSPAARFCHLCGTPTALAASARPAAASLNASNLGWIAVGLASVAIIVVIGTQFIDRNGPADQVANRPPPVVSSAPAPDISSMTPRERADRLFERIMIADSRGFADTVSFFTPMALQAYALLGDLDIDARYHVGLIQGLAGNEEAVESQSASIREEAATHLMAPMLDYTLSRLRNDSAGMISAYQEFLDNYPAEIGLTRNEYAAHQTALESFRQDATAASQRPESLDP